MTFIMYCERSGTDVLQFIFYIFRGPTTSDNHHCTGVVHYERAATVVCCTSSCIGMYFACHALEDLASAGNMVDVMR